MRYATNNFAFYFTKIAVQLLWEIAYFPLWWYSSGLIHLLESIREFMSNRQKELAFFVWTKNILVPMYGEYNWEGRLISFFVRLVQIIVRGIILLIWMAFCVIALALWIAVPPVVVWQIFYQLTILFT